MDILFLLIPLSVVLVFAIGVAFWRAIDTGQFDDLEAPALRILTDDDNPVIPADDKPVIPAKAGTQTTRSAPEAGFPPSRE